MSLAIATYVPEGIVMASDSRESITVEGKMPDGKELKVETVNSDAVNKTFLLEKQRVGVSTFGVSQLAGLPMASHIKKFIEEEVRDADDVAGIAGKLLKYFKLSFPNADVGFHVAGYKKENKVSIPHVFYCHVGRSELARKNVNPDPDSSLTYGATWSGQVDVIAGLINPVAMMEPSGSQRIVKPVAPIVWGAMALQDAVDFSVFAIRTTIDAIRFQARPKNVGGVVDVLVITPEEARWVKKKQLEYPSI